MIMSIHVGRASTYPSTMFYTLQCVYKWDKTKMISIKTGYSLKRYPLKEVWLYSDCICFFPSQFCDEIKLWCVCVCQFSVRHGTGSLAHRVNGSFGSSFTSGSPGVRPKFCRFSKKCQKCKMYVWNAEMTKVIVRCLLLDWNHWMSVHAMNFYFYLWLLKICTPLHISRHLEFIIEQGLRVAGS